MRFERQRTAVVALATLAAASILLSGCVDVAAPDPDGSAAPAYVSTWEEPAPIEIAPLRGTQVEPGSVSNSSIAAKIDNHLAARPQVGLDTTDIVFEEMVEGGLTRYVAIWQSTIPKELGPVRSIRPMDPDILSPFKGIVAYSGGQPRFVQLMKDSGVYNAIHGQSDTADTFFRSTTKQAPHNVLVKAREVIADHKKIPAPAQQFGYSLDLASSTAVTEGKPISAIKLVFGPPSQPSWKWSEESSTWLRSQMGEKDKDSKGKQLAATNVVVIRVGVSNGLGVPKTELVGYGEAWVSAGGHVVKAKWSKSSRTARIKLTDVNGATIHLAPGNTWFELVPTTGSAKFVDAS